MTDQSYDPDTIPDYVDEVRNVGTCTKCPTRILWVVTKRGKFAPLDLDAPSDAFGKLQNHFATCAAAKSFRK